MPSIDPFEKLKPISMSRKRRTKLPSFRTVVIVIIVFCGLVTSKTVLMNQYNYIKGLQYWRAGNLTLASMEFNKVLTRTPGDAKAVDGLGLVAMKAGDLDKAQTLYSQAMQMGLTYNHKFDHLRTGQSFIDQGEYPQAELELQHALALQPNNPRIDIALGTTERALDHISQAVKYYETALQLEPNNKEAQKLLTEVDAERDRGAVYYMYDRNGVPLALQWTKTGAISYPMGKEFAHIIGYDDQSTTNNRGSAGLESIYHKYFPGDKLYLTIDSRIQMILSKALGWEKGAIIVLNPHTGEILGCVSQPTYTPEKVHDDWWQYVDDKNDPLKNRAFESLYEPGSIIKVITSAVAVEKNINMSTVFPLFCKGYMYIDGKIFYDNAKHGLVRNLNEAFDCSCNVAYGKLGLVLGEDALFEYDNRFGLNSVPKTIQLPITQGSSPKLGLTPYQLAESATGLGSNYRITPLNGALIASAIADDGVIMSPYLVEKLTNISGKILKENKPVVYEKAISRQTAQYVTTLMVNEVDRGIGIKARVPGLKIAGKTGTAGSRNPNFDAWFICFFPAENPKIAMAILCENGGEGKDVAAPIAKNVIEGMMKFMNFSSDSDTE